MNVNRGDCENSNYDHTQYNRVQQIVCLLFTGCLMAHRHLGHTGATLDVDALARHAQDAEYSVAIVVKFYWKTAISTPKLL
jgi:hypothetical protein